MLEAAAFLGVLNEPDVEWLVANSKQHKVESGSVLIRRGQPVEFLYLIVDGAFDVTVFVPKKPRGERHIATLYAGELMGEMSFVDSHPPSATVTAGMNCSVLAITKAALTEKIENDTGFGARFYRGVSVLLAGRLRAKNASVQLQASPGLRSAGVSKYGALTRRAAISSECQRHSSPWS